jgi:hypothetical protein
MLRFVIDFDFRMIRTEVALAAILRHTRRRGAERMPAVAGSAGSFAAVGIDTANAAVWPRDRIEASLTEILHFATVALAAAVVRRRAAFDNFSQHVIERTDEFRRCRVMAFFKLPHLGGVTPRAIVGRHDHGDSVPVMVECGGIRRVRLVAGKTVRAFFSRACCSATVRRFPAWKKNDTQGKLCLPRKPAANRLQAEAPRRKAGRARAQDVSWSLQFVARERVGGLSADSITRNEKGKREFPEVIINHRKLQCETIRASGKQPVGTRISTRSRERQTMPDASPAH